MTAIDLGCDDDMQAPGFQRRRIGELLITAFYTEGKPVLLLEETNLAWALAEAAKPYMNAVERNDVYMAIGVGETFAAIRQLIATAAAKRIPIAAT
jgi:hypothetical protein